MWAQQYVSLTIGGLNRLGFIARVATMYGTFQRAVSRLQVEAEAERIRYCLVNSQALSQWLWPQVLDESVPEELAVHTEFITWIGPICLPHQVSLLTEDRMSVLMWGLIDGYTEWSWGNGWVQLRVEAISPLPLTLAHTQTLRQLQLYAASGTWTELGS